MEKTRKLPGLFEEERLLSLSTVPRWSRAFGIMERMQTSGSQDSSSQVTFKTVIGACIGGLILLALCVVAIFQASHEESVLGWIVAGILLAWLGVAIYLAMLVMRQVKLSQREYAALAQRRRSEEESMLQDKLAHSFQIVLVQSNVIKEQLAENGPDAREMIDRALDTIDTTAKNGMSMAKES